MILIFLYKVLPLIVSMGWVTTDSLHSRVITLVGHIYVLFRCPSFPLLRSRSGQRSVSNTNASVKEQYSSLDMGESSSLTSPTISRRGISHASQMDRINSWDGPASSNKNCPSKWSCPSAESPPNEPFCSEPAGSGWVARRLVRCHMSTSNQPIPRELHMHQGLENVLRWLSMNGSADRLGIS